MNSNHYVYQMATYGNHKKYFLKGYHKSLQKSRCNQGVCTLYGPYQQMYQRKISSYLYIFQNCFQNLSRIGFVLVRLPTPLRRIFSIAITNSCAARLVKRELVHLCFQGLQQFIQCRYVKLRHNYLKITFSKPIRVYSLNW